MFDSGVLGTLCELISDLASIDTTRLVFKILAKIFVQLCLENFFKQSVQGHFW